MNESWNSTVDAYRQVTRVLSADLSKGGILKAASPLISDLNKFRWAYENYTFSAMLRVQNRDSLNLDEGF